MAHDKDQEKKIKELEQALAQELDQQVKLTNPSDPLMAGGVDLNPTLNLGGPAQPKAEPEAAPVPNTDKIPNATYEAIPKPDRPKEEPTPTAPTDGGEKEEEISLEDLDNILAQESPELQKEIEALRNAGSDPNAQNIDLSATDVSEHEVHDEVDLALPKKRSLWLRLKEWIKERFNRFMDMLYFAPIKGYKYTVKFVKSDLKDFVAGAFYKSKNLLNAGISGFKALSWIQRLVLFLMMFIPVIIMTVLLGSFGKFSIGKTNIHESFLESFEQEYSFDTKKKFVPLSEDGEYPENVVLLERIVVNIRPSANSGNNPMAAVRLYFDLSTREGAIEVKDREKEMRDLSQRVLETFSYDQIVTAEGKKMFKESLRREISAVLNNGVMREVYIDDILLKP